MATSGDTYTVKLLQAHLGWGTHRHTNTRPRIYGEGYIPIPSSVANDFGIYNSNQATTSNIYLCNSVDGYLQNVELKAAGSSTAGSIYAKQFHGNGNLRLIGDWYRHLGASIGDRVKVTWVNSHQITIELL